MTGRVQQKQRTREALLDAAREVLRSGREVTISAVAQEARVSSATAYRYFSQPNDLVLEAFWAQGPLVVTDLPEDPVERVDAVVRRLAEMQFDDEQLWRTVLAAALETGVRSGARLEMTTRALEPVAERLGPELHRRLVSALMLVYGMEAIIVLRDGCGLEPEEATDVMRWSAAALVRGALAEVDPATPHHPRPGSG